MSAITPLPSDPNLENLRKQAKTLLKSVRDGTDIDIKRIRQLHPAFREAIPQQIREGIGLSDAQWVIAYEHGFESWPKLKDYVITSGAPFEAAIRAGDGAKVRVLLRDNPKLLQGDISWLSCRKDRSVLWYGAWAGNDAVVRAIVDAGYDLKQDGPEVLGMALCRGLFSAADFLVERGVAPLDSQMTLFQLSEDLNPEGLRWMLKHGADPDFHNSTKEDGSWTPLDNAIHTYPARPKLRQETVRTLFEAGAAHQDNALFDLLSGDLEGLRQRLVREPALLEIPFDIDYQRNQSLEFGGQYGGAPLINTTLLHHCAEFGFEEEARLLISLGGNVNARATPRVDGFSTHTPIFNALTTNYNQSFEVLKLLLESGADPMLQADVDLFIWERQIDSERWQRRGITPLEYIGQFPNDYHKKGRDGAKDQLDTAPHAEVVELLRKYGA